MFSLILILVFVTRVYSETQSMQYHMHVSRKSRSSSVPLETGYVYSQVNNDPGTLATFGSDISSGYNSAPSEPSMGKHSDSMTINYGDSYNVKYSDKSQYNDSPMTKKSDKEKFSKQTTKYDSSSVDKYSDMPKDQLLRYDAPVASKYTSNGKYDDKFSKFSDAIPVVDTNTNDHSTHISFLPPTDISPSHIPVTTYTEPPMTDYSVDYAVAKAEAKYDSKFLPSKMKSDAMYERLKSLMHYHPSPETMTEYGYDTMSDYHIDDDDIRTSSRSPYDSWPYFYHSPYEYEHMKIDSDIQKAKDKRYAMETTRKIIPVHEDHEHDMPSGYVHTTAEPTTPDNPINGDQPFFSFVLNDYFQKNDEDPLTFKGLDWGKDFDYRTGGQEVDTDGKRNRRLQTNYNYFPTGNSDGTINSLVNNNHGISEVAKGQSATEKAYQKKHEFDKHEKGDEKKDNHKSDYEHNGNNYQGYKDIVDTFANKFGAADQKKDSKYVLKKNQDKGEKRKGFRRVYHKDEYQEDNEFYDNTNNSANAEEKGSSAAHTGGSEAFLQSHAAAALGNDANAYNKAGNTYNNNFEKNHEGHDYRKGSDTDINRYRDVARKAAHSNNADYLDHYI